MATFWGLRWGPVSHAGWMVSVTMAGGLASVVWGGTSVAIGVLSGGATFLIALALIWLLRVGARGQTSA